MKSENTVFTHDGHDIRCDTYRHDIEQRDQMMKLDTVADGERLHKLETDPATGKVCVWIRIIQALGIQNGYGRWKHLIRHMMVADDKVDSFLFGIGDFLYSLYAAIEYNNKSYTGFGGIVHSFFRNTIPLVVTVGYIIVKVRIELLNKLVDQCYRSSAVYVIISIN